MYKLKPHKSVEQIAKKHRMNVYDIQKQLDMGEPIEHEHTKNHKLAMDIALQHLDEIPDYYTRLKKMEASAKKEHKKFKDVKEATDGIKAKDYKGRLDKWFDDDGWVQTGGKYDGKPCAKQPGQNTKPYCRDPDDRAAMGKDERNKRAAKKRREDPNPNRSGKAKMVTQESAGEKDACYKKVKSRYDVWPSAYASGALVKCRKVGAANWGNKSESIDIKSKDPLSEEMGIRYCPKCEKDETRDECKYGPKYWDMFSSPSSLSPNQLKFSIAQVHPANESKEYNQIKEDHKEIASGKKKDDEGYMARSEFDTIMKAVSLLRKNIKKGNQQLPAWVQSKITKATDYIDTASDYLDSDEANVDEAKKCWTGYKKKGMKTMFGKKYPNCVKINESNYYDTQDNKLEEENQGPSSPVKSYYPPDDNPGAPIIIGPNRGAAGIKYPVRYKPPLATNTLNKSTVQMASYEIKGNQIHENPGDGYLGPTPIPNPIRLAQDSVDATNRATQKKVNAVNEILPGRASMKKPTYFNTGPSAASKQYLGLQNSYEPEIKSFTKFMYEASAAWQRKEGKNPEGGLNAAGVASYRRQNPGSKLQTAVTTKPSKLKPGSKDAKRRKSFCARMGGMPGPMKDEKGRPTRKALALRKWNC